MPEPEEENVCLFLFHKNNFRNCSHFIALIFRRNYKKENSRDESEEENIEKICYICKKDEDESNLMICDRCKACFCHYYCIKLKKKPQKWYCRYCREDIKEIRENKKKIVHFFL